MPHVPTTQPLMWAHSGLTVHSLLARVGAETGDMTMNGSIFFIGFFCGMIFMFLALMAIGDLVDRGYVDFTPNVEAAE